MPLDIYAEEMVSHYEHPHNKKKIEDASISFHNENTSCGDSLTIYLQIKDGVVVDVGFEGTGCAISMGSASMITDFLKGKTLEEIEEMDKSTVIDVIGINPGPARMHCATLSMRAAKEAVFAYEKKKPDNATKEL